MSLFNRLTALVAVAAMLGPLTPLEGKTRKGDKFYSEGKIAEAKKDWDTALENFEKALSEDPADVAYQMAANGARFQAGQMHVDNGLKLRAKGQLGDALLEFQKAYTINPGSTVAVQEIELTRQMIERERKRVEDTGTEAPAEERAMTPAQEEKKREEEKINRILPVPELKPTIDKPIDLKMNSQTVKTLYETVGRYAGINVLWDPEIQLPAPPKDKLSVDIQNATIDEAFDYLAVQTKTFWKPISSNTIFVTNDNLNKRRDYEDDVTKIFYLTNAITPQEVTEIITAARTIADCQKMYPYQSQYAIVARCSADRMTLATKIIHDLDRPKSEVVVDILVLEASNVFSRQIQSGLNTLNVPFTFSPRSSIQVQGNNNNNNNNNNGSTTTTTINPLTGQPETTTIPTTTGTTTTSSSTTGSMIPLSAVGHLSSADYAVTLPSAVLQAALSDSTTKVLQSPQLRSVEGVKASLKIGDREPTASGSFQPGIGGVGINPLVNTQFQYIDVGVNVTITPRVHDNDEISMDVDMDISAVDGTVNLGGIDQPIIGQKKVQHSIRMREGQVSLLAGLVQNQETKKLSGIPLLSSIPVLRRLFTSTETDRNKDQLMIALIPHIVRRPVLTPEMMRAVVVGTQATTELHYAPKPLPPSPKPAGGQEAQAAGNPPSTTPATFGPPATTAPPATAPPATAPPATAPPETAPGTPPATAPPATTNPTTPAQQQPPGSASIRVAPARVTATMGNTVTIAVLVDGGTDITAAPMQIQFDPKAVKLNDVTLGDLFLKGGQQPVFTRNIMNDTGTGSIQLGLAPGTPGVSGPGMLVNLVFQAVGRGTSTVNISGLSVTNSQGQVLASGNLQVPVEIK